MLLTSRELSLLRVARYYAQLEAGLLTGRQVGVCVIWLTVAVIVVLPLRIVSCGLIAIVGHSSCLIIFHPVEPPQSFVAFGIADWTRVEETQVWQMIQYEVPVLLVAELRLLLFTVERQTAR